MKGQMLYTNTTRIPIVYTAPMRETLELPPRSELRVKLPVNLLNGDAILDFKQFTEGIRMPAALVSCVNGYATTVIQNYKLEQMTLVITAPFKVEAYSDEKINLNSRRT